MTNSAYAKNNGDGLLYSILSSGYEIDLIRYLQKYFDNYLFWWRKLISWKYFIF
jgi:hypothetical protein